MGEGLARYLFSGALKQPTIINPNLGKSCWRGGYASRNFGGSGAKRQLRTCLEQPMLARDTLGGARSLQQELVRADVAPPQRLKARLIVCGIQGIAEAMP